MYVSTYMCRTSVIRSLKRLVEIELTGEIIKKVVNALYKYREVLQHI
jgi:hypothetical protein